MVDHVQAQLEAIYSWSPDFKAAQFVVSDPETAKALGATCRSSEELLMRESEPGEQSMDVALYFSPALLARLAAFEGRPLASLLANELNGFCQLTEGVSHLLYLAFAAQEGRKISLLELEAQAEVDKFACCLLPRWSEATSSWPEELYRRLFFDVGYVDSLSAEEQARYREANALSREYCKRLLQHAKARRLDKLLSELRFSYRLGAGAKWSHWSRSRNH